MTVPLPNWFIQRIALIYYDPLRLQWQLFQSTTRPSKIPYREYIRQLLISTEKLISRAAEGSKFALSERTHGKSNKTQITFNLEDVRNKREALTLCSDRREVWNVLVAKLQGLADESKLNLKNKIKEISNLVIKVSDTKKPSSGVRVESLENVTLDYDAALELLSILPIRRHWDTYGRWSGFDSDLRQFRQSRNSNCGELSASSNSKNESGKLKESYLYGSKFTFKDRNSKKTDKNAKSTKLLGYEVRIETFGTDLNNYSKNLRSEEEEDFFDYCWYPQGDEDIFPNALQGQTDLYQFYAFFNDTIIEQIEQLDAAPKKQGSKKRDSSEIFVITYPLTTLGRTHFLQIYISANPKSGKHGLARLWFDWQKVHDNINWSESKVCLAEDIEQIELARFQSLVNTPWPEPYSEYNEVPEDVYKSSICRVAPLLFSVDTASSDDGRDWGYGYDSIPIGKDSASKITISHKWERCSSAKEESPSRIERSGISLYHSNKSTQAIELLYQGRREMLLQQQIELSEELKSSLRDKREAERKGRIENIRETLRLASRQQKQNLKKLLTQVSDEQITQKTIELNGKQENLGDLLSPWCIISDDDKPSWTSAKREIQRLLAPKITEAFSEYFGIGVVKHITHKTEFFSGTVGEMLDDYTRIYQHLSDVLEDCTNSELLCNLTKVKEFHDEALELLKDYSPEIIKRDLYNKPLETKRKQVTFTLSWDKDANISAIEELPPANLEKFQVFCPIHILFKDSFDRISTSLPRINASITKRLSFAKKWKPHSSQCYLGSPSLFCNYLILRYQSKSLDPKVFEEGKAEFIERFLAEGIEKYGYFYVALGGDNGSVIYDYTVNGCAPKKVLESTVFPCDIPDNTKSDILNLGKDEACIILAFDSWRC
jgi:hypothetical protein